MFGGREGGGGGGGAAVTEVVCGDGGGVGVGDAAASSVLDSESLGDDSKGTLGVGQASSRKVGARTISTFFPTGS